MRPTPLTLLNGFLGAGKTTLLRRLMAQGKQAGIPLGVIVNDMSALEVDGVLAGNNESAVAREQPLISLFGVDISSPAGLQQFDAALRSLSRQQVQHILVETSGASHPLPLVRHLQHRPSFALKQVLVLMDAVMLSQDYDEGATLLPRLQANLRAGTRDVSNLIVEQILFCSQLLLTRADRLQPSRIHAIAQALHPINPHVPILAVERGSLPLENLLNAPGYDFHRVALLIEELQPALEKSDVSDPALSLEHRVLVDPRPFHPERLWQVYREQLGTGIHRSKGFFWLPSRDDVALLWNQAAGSIDLEIVSDWKSGALSHTDNRLTREEREALRRQVQAIHPVFGDRRCELTVIGESAQLDEFIAALRQCFATPQEIRHWQNGGAFADPWPTRLMKIDVR